MSDSDNDFNTEPEDNIENYGNSGEEDQIEADQPDSFDQPKKKRLRLDKFIDHAVDDDHSDDLTEEEEEEEEDEEDRKFIDNNTEAPELTTYLRHDNDMSDDETEKTQSKKKKKQKKVHRRSQESELNRQLAEKFKSSAYSGNKDYMIVSNPKTYLIPIEEYRTPLEPTIETNRLYTFRVKLGKEFEVIQRATEKMLETSLGQNLVSVFAAFTPKVGSGIVYVEALDHAQAATLMTDIRFVMTFTIPIQLPYDQMRQAIAVQSARTELRPGSFVVIKRDITKTDRYKGDIGQVVEVDMNSNRCLVKLIPRIDYSALQNLRSEDGDENEASDYISVEGKQSYLTAKKGPGYRPPQAEFNVGNITNFGGSIIEEPLMSLKKRSYSEVSFTWDDQHFLGPFVYKSYPFSYLSTKDANPSADIMNKFIEGLNQTGFEKNIPGFQANMNASIGKARASTFNIGDFATVLPGHELDGLNVRIVGIENGMAKVRVLDTEYYDEDITIELASLERLFRDGDQVKIIDGDYKGETGHVLNISDRTAHIYLDSLNSPVEVDVDFLTHTKEVSAGRDRFGIYRKFDMIHMHDDSQGVIYRIESNHVMVLLTNNENRSVTMTQIRGRLPDIPCFDTKRNRISPNSSVKISLGENQNTRATVIHTYKPYVFVQGDAARNFGGLFVIQDYQCSVMSGGTQTNRPVQVRQTVAPRPARDPTMIGKTILIKHGPHTGRYADVKEATTELIKCTLQSSGKVVSFMQNEKGIKWTLYSPAPQDPFSFVFGGVSAPAPPQEAMSAGSMAPQPTYSEPYYGGMDATPYNPFQPQPYYPQPPQSVYSMAPPQPMGMSPPQSMGMPPPQPMGASPGQPVGMSPPQTMGMSPPQPMGQSPAGGNGVSPYWSPYGGQQQRQTPYANTPYQSTPYSNTPYQNNYY